MFRALSSKPESRQRDYLCADGMLIEFNLDGSIPVDILFFGYVDSLCAHVEVSEMITPKDYGKYLDELQAHIDSLGDEADDLYIDERRAQG